MEPSENKMETGPREEAVGFPSRERRDRPTRREDVMAEELGTEATESRVNSGADSPSTSRVSLWLINIHTVLLLRIHPVWNDDSVSFGVQ